MTRKYRAIATDFDGTIAYRGVVRDIALSALKRLKANDYKVVLVTGRQLDQPSDDSLHDVFPRAFASGKDRLFEQIVLENGAVLHTPETHETRNLVPEDVQAKTAQDARLLAGELRRRGLPRVTFGRAVVSSDTTAKHRPSAAINLAWLEEIQTVMQAAIHELELDWRITLNKKNVMALPAGVTKATGLQVALAEINKTEAEPITLEETIGIGDGENDLALLDLCGYGVALDNSVRALKDTADLVTKGGRGEGFKEFVDSLLAGTLPERKRL
jgi:HAD superfamily hydrolase (TIGR01484 family)